MKKIFLILPAIFFIADRIFKHLAPSINFEGGFVKSGFYKNYAGAFSLPIGGWLYNFAGIILLIFFIYLFFKEIEVLSSRAKSRDITSSKERANEISLRPRIEYGVGRNDKAVAYFFIILGGFSNMLDRIALGYSIDYVNFLDFSFFNIADGMLLGGIILLFINIKRMPPQNPKSQIPNPK